jgi:hypothetical protein
MTDVERAKITINKFGALLLQALAKAPTGIDLKNFDYSINQPLDEMSKVPTLGEVTTVIQSAHPVNCLQEQSLPMLRCWSKQ